MTMVRIFEIVQLHCGDGAYYRSQ